jgi:hypothetical protein
MGEPRGLAFERDLPGADEALDGELRGVARDVRGQRAAQRARGHARPQRLGAVIGGEGIE